MIFSNRISVPLEMSASLPYQSVYVGLQTEGEDMGRKAGLKSLAPFLSVIVFLTS